MKALKTIIITTNLLLGTSMPVFASDKQDEFDPSPFKRLNRDHPHPCFKSEDIPQWRLDTLLYELRAGIMSFLPRKDQVSVRRVSHTIDFLYIYANN